MDVINRYYEGENARGDGMGRRAKDGGEVHRALEKLEKDHRNLVKHCLAM